MRDDLDEIITAIQVNVPLRAEARNALHGATSGHPWCAGKDLKQRAMEVRCAIAGYRVPVDALQRLERMSK